ncbi:MAG: hypothetical protein ACP5XB_14365 [Isosphaeraceae bacterium]
MSTAGRIGKWVRVSVKSAVLFGLFLPAAGAQAPPTSLDGSPGIRSPNEPLPLAPSAGSFTVPAFGDTGGSTATPVGSPTMTPTGASTMAPTGAPPPATSTGPALSALEVIRASLFDDIYSDEAKARWTPLPLSTFFTEGWNTPFVLPTSSSGGAPRQGWVSAFGGQFFRAWFFAFAYTQGINSNLGNGYLGRYTIFAPLNRRLEFQVDSLFIVSNKGGASNTYHGNVGDTYFWANFQLSESKNFGQTLGLGVAAPTGRTENAQGLNALWPTYRFLWFPGGGKWMVRGETGPIIPLASTGYTQYQSVLAAGRYFPGSKDSLFQQWWLYLVAIQTSTVTGTPRRESLVTVMPGMRCKIPGLTLGTGAWYFFADVNVPLTGPQSFSYQPIFAILYDY